MKRNLLLILSLWSALTGLQAQKLTVEGMTASPMDLSASQYERKDFAGQACGLVKVQLADEGAQFEGNVFGKVEYKTGEYWVYMTQGAYMLRIKHPKFVPLDVNFRDYGISGVDGKITYVLTLLIPQSSAMGFNDGMNYLALTVEPANAMVYIDGELNALHGGTLSLLLPMGEHQYRVEAPTYKPESGSFTIGSERLPMTVKLSSVMSSLSVTSITLGTEIYVNDSLYSTSSWHGSLPSGNYRIEGRLAGYRSYRQSVTLKPSEDIRLTIPALQHSTGMIDVNCQPMNAEVWIDGRRAGTNPEVFRNIAVGRHEVELRADGYGSEKMTVQVEDGQTALVKKSLKRLLSADQDVVIPVLSPVSDSFSQNEGTITVKGVSFNMVRVEGGTFTMGYNMFESLELSSRLEEANVIVQKLDYLRDYIANPANKYNTIPSTFIPSIVEQTKSSLINSYNQAVNDHNRLIKNVNDQTPQAQTLSVKIDELQDSLRGALLQLRRSADVNRQMIQEMFMKYKNDEKMGNQVTLSDYWIGETEVTQELWMAVMGNNPSHFLGPKLPVEHVSMLDCQIFIDKLNHLTGKKFRLPTEAEWEYAAKGGSKSNNYLYSGSNNFNDVAWYLGNSGSTTHDVGQKAHNELGLYDMSGNVYEWCWFQNRDEDTPMGMGTMGVGRGGCWVDKLEDCRVSARSSFPSDLSCNLIGFRLAL